MLTLTKTSTTRHSVLLFVFTVVGIFLLKGLQAKKASLLSHSSTSSRVRIPRDFPTSIAPDNVTANITRGESQLEVQYITGYWKEIRASLGLSPLPDTVIISTSLDITASSSAEDELHLRRLGRLNPTLRRRLVVFNSDSHPREEEAQNRSEQSRETAYGFPDPLERTQPRYRLATYPDLFLAPSTPDRRLTPVNSLAASFRAIAARELKARRNSARLRRDNRALR